MINPAQRFAKHLIVIALLGLAGCGSGASGGATTTDRPAQSFLPSGIKFHICPFILSLKQLVYPADGSTGISPSTHVIVVTGSGNQVTLTSPGLPPIVSQQKVSVPNPLPQPNSGAFIGLEGFQIPTLAPTHTYTIVVQNTTLVGCPDGAPVTVGSFQTGYTTPVPPTAAQSRNN